MSVRYRPLRFASRCARISHSRTAIWRRFPAGWAKWKWPGNTARSPSAFLPEACRNRPSISAMNRDYVTIVSGLPRSGTSLMMQMLHAGGMPVLSDALRPPDESNPRGYFEFEPVKRLRAERSWLPRARGHAVKIIHLLLRELPLDGSFTFRIVFMQRPMDEIIASQRVMLGEGKAAAPAILQRVFETQLAQLEPWLRGRTDVTVLPIAYHRAFREPDAVVEELRSFLGLDLDGAAMVRAVDPALYRQRGEGR